MPSSPESLPNPFGNLPDTELSMIMAVLIVLALRKISLAWYS
jgi:hypothetical protein